MKGDPRVLEAIQIAINLEASLSLAYYLNGKALKFDLGLKTGKELCGLAKQSCKFKKLLVKNLLLLDGKPEISPDTAALAAGVGAALNELLALENTAVGKYTEFTQICFDAESIGQFHFFQHLIKWHTGGGNGFDGHIQYLEHELKQLNKLGEVQYIAAHV